MLDQDSESAAVIALSPLPALLVDPASDRILQANPAAAGLLGTEPKGRGLRDFLADDPGQLIVFADAVAHFGQSWTRNVALQDGAENPLECEIRGQYLETPEGPRLALHLIDLRQMTRHADTVAAAAIHRGGLYEWQRAQTFFSELERQNQLILDAAGEGIYGVNADGKATFVNRAAQEMLCWTEDDLLGRDIHTTIHHHHLSGERYHRADCPIYKSFRNEQVNRIEDEVFWRKDGKPIRVEYVSTPIYDDQVLAGAVVIFRDITERWENEQRLREALDQIAELRDRLEAENAYLQEEILTERAHDEIIGTSSAIKQLLAQIALVAPTEANVMITGESGTGKALVASAIHKASDRRRRPLIRFNCGAASLETIASDLFGHVRGGAPNAMRDKAGILELAHSGTLYLEEVTELPLDIQGRLLGALQERAVQRLGEERLRSLDIRVIASSSRPLDREIAAGRVREDFYFHLNVFPVACTPLRDRPEDIPLLAAHSLKLICKRLNRKPPLLTQGTVRALSQYHWPGNVRELENVIERAVIVSTGNKLVVDLQGGAASPAARTGPATILTEQELRQLEVTNLIACLKETGGKVSGAGGAAELLGVQPTTLYSRIRKLGVTRDDWA